MSFSIDRILHCRPNTAIHPITTKPRQSEACEAPSTLQLTPTPINLQTYYSYCLSALAQHSVTPRHCLTFLSGHAGNPSSDLTEGAWMNQLAYNRTSLPLLCTASSPPSIISNSEGVCCTATSPPSNTSNIEGVCNSENSLTANCDQMSQSSSDSGLDSDYDETRTPQIRTTTDKDKSMMKAKTEHLKKSRTIFTSEQLQDLEKYFSDRKYLSKFDRSRLASTLGLSERQVKTWYQNRRTRWKRDCSEKEWSTEREVSASSIYSQYVRMKSLKTTTLK